MESDAHTLSDRFSAVEYVEGGVEHPGLGKRTGCRQVLPTGDLVHVHAREVDRRTLAGTGITAPRSMDLHATNFHMPTAWNDREVGIDGNLPARHRTRDDGAEPLH